MYNALKLSKYRSLFRPVRVLIVGAGAVGVTFAECLVKMGVSMDAVDFDFFTTENAAKHGCMVRTPEDVGRNKAECVSARAQPYLDEGCTSNGIDTDVCKLGPEAFSDYDFVEVAVDNYAAKVLVNEQIRRLPEERRPVVLMAGTRDETAQSVICDNTQFCLRCLIDESWLEHDVRTSCTGAQVRRIDGVPEIVRTSHLASATAAHLSAEQIRACVIGHEGVMNRRLTYTAYPNLGLSVSQPQRKHGCPGCAVKPPKSIEWLRGTTTDVTLGEALRMIAEALGTENFEILSHRLNYRQTVYAGFVTDSVCHCCGKPISVMKHEGRLFPQDLLCDACAASGKAARMHPDFARDTILYAFTPGSAPSVKDKTLFELGFPLGAHIEVIERTSAPGRTDAGKIRKTVFAFDGDHARMHTVRDL